VRDQALGRTKRRGNPSSWVRHISLTTKDSFNTQQVANLILKSPPALWTQLNLDIWGKSEGDEEGDESQRTLRDYVLHEGKLYPVDDPAVADLKLTPLYHGTSLVYIQQLLSGAKISGDQKTLKKQAAGPKKPEEAVPALKPLWTAASSSDVK
jgi:hypothetical protein